MPTRLTTASVGKCLNDEAPEPEGVPSAGGEGGGGGVRL